MKPGEIDRQILESTGEASSLLVPLGKLQRGGDLWCSSS